MGQAITPFRIETSEADIEALHRRLGRTRWPRELGDNTRWRDGAPLAWMRDLVDYWREGFDWRAQEQAMNVLPQFRATIGGEPLHFVHQRGAGPRPLPLLLAHGWPWTFWDLKDLIGPLSDPAAHGGDPADAFDVIAPSLPGFAFSSPSTTPGLNHVTAARSLAELMTCLGHHRFGVQGGDLGALVAGELGHAHPERTVGLHLHSILSVRAPYLVTNDELVYGGGEEDWAKRNLAFLQSRSGYLYVQRTRPQSMAFALHNSPAGLAAWLADAGRAITGSPPETPGDRDALLTRTMLYWLTGTFASSAAYFFNARPDRSDLVPLATPRADVPTAVIQFPGDPMLCPRDWAERRFDVRSWRMADTAGVVSAVQAPAILAEDIRAFFRPLRA